MSLLKFPLIKQLVGLYVFIEDIFESRKNYFHKNHEFSYKLMIKLILYFGNFFTSAVSDFLLKKKSFFPDLIEESYRYVNKISTTEADLLRNEIENMTMIEKVYENNLVIRKNELGENIVDVDYYKKKNLVRIDVKQECLANSKLI